MNTLNHIAAKNRLFETGEIFKNIPADKILLLSELFEPVDFSDGQIIFNEGDDGDCLFLICEGIISIEIDGIIIARRSTGECIGEMSLIDGGKRSAAAIAIGAVKTYRLSVAKFNNLLLIEPIVGYNIFRILSRRIREDIITQKQINLKLNKAHTELKKLDELKENILANISHELRTPLTIIRGYNELLLKKDSSNLNEKQKTQLKKSIVNIENLNYIIGNLLEISKLKTGNCNLEISYFDINSLIPELVKKFKDKIELKNIKLKIELPDNRTFLTGDIHKLGLAITNIIDNAIKFNKDNGEVIIKTAIQSGNLVLMISDTGIGIADDIKEQIFDVFYQADSATTRKFGGTGIGLSVSNGIIKLHNGTINIDSIINVGTTVSFSIPIKPEKMQ